MGNESISARLRADFRLYSFPLLFIFIVLGLPAGIGAGANVLRDGDVSWHIAAGRWILQHRAIPTTDPFSYTVFGHPWVDTEWLAEIIYAPAYNLFGHSGSSIVVMAALIALNAAIFFYLQRRVSRIVIAITLVALDLELGRFALARPHVLSWPLLALWTIALLQSAEHGRPPKLWWALVLVIWTNIHASFPLALPVAAAIGLDTLIATRWKGLRAWIVFGLLSILALCLNANGIAGLLRPFHISSLSMLTVIGEWKPSTPGNSAIFFVLLLCGLGAALWSGLRVPIGRLLLLLLMLGLAFTHIRHQSSFAIVAACTIPTLWVSQPSATQIPYWALAGALPFLLGRALIPLTSPENRANPWPMIAAVPDELRSQPVFNEYSFGGPLISSGIRPYIDGRADPYGDAYVKNYSEMSEYDFEAFERTVDQFKI